MYVNLHLHWVMFGFVQMSLVEMPERSKKKLMALTTNVMRDDSDKVKLSFLFSLRIADVIHVYCDSLPF